MGADGLPRLCLARDQQPALIATPPQPRHQKTKGDTPLVMWMYTSAVTVIDASSVSSIAKSPEKAFSPLHVRSPPDKMSL